MRKEDEEERSEKWETPGYPFTGGDSYAFTRLTFVCYLFVCFFGNRHDEVEGSMTFSNWSWCSEMVVLAWSHDVEMTMYRPTREALIPWVILHSCSMQASFLLPAIYNCSGLVMKVYSTIRSQSNPLIFIVFHSTLDTRPIDIVRRPDHVTCLDGCLLFLLPLNSIFPYS